MSTFEEQLGAYADHDLIKGRVKDVEGLAKRVVDSQAEIARRVAVPGADASDEDKAAFLDRLKTAAPNLVEVPDGDDADLTALYRRLGAPEKPEGYAAPDDDGLKQIHAALAPKAHAYGLNDKQFGGLVKDIADIMAAGQEHIDSTVAEAKAALKSKWGEAYTERHMFARMAAEHHGILELVESNPLFGNNVQVMELLAGLGEKLAEDESVATVLRTRSGVATLGELVQRRNEILNNPDHPYNKPVGFGGREQAVQDMLNLNAQIRAAKGKT